jgi:hypothetical protein
MQRPSPYEDELRRIKSLLIVTSLQQRKDLQAIKLIQAFGGRLAWNPLSRFMIEPGVWKYVVTERKYDPQRVFCHPEVLLRHPVTSAYYRGLCALSIKSAKPYFGAVEGLEAGNPGARLRPDKALKMARTYNAFICSILANSAQWTLENGYRTVVATMGITLDGIMRNRVGDIAEDRVRNLILEYVVSQRLVMPAIPAHTEDEKADKTFPLQGGVVMKFSSEPDIAFTKQGTLLVVVEIKGGIDAAGALERYGAATNSFQHAMSESPRCKNFYLAGVLTPELNKRIDSDRLVEKSFNIVEMLENPELRSEFFSELFHHALRLI